MNERWAFRFPQRAIGVPGLELELAVLPLLAARLPLPVPNPVFVGRAEGDYPWPFFGSELLPGQETCDAGRVTVNGQEARAGREVHVGDTISIRMPRRQLSLRVRSIPSHAPSKESVREMIELLGSELVQFMGLHVDRVGQAGLLEFEIGVECDGDVAVGVVIHLVGAE